MKLYTVDQMNNHLKLLIIYPNRNCELFCKFCWQKQNILCNVNVDWWENILKAGIENGFRELLISGGEPFSDYLTTMKLMEYSTQIGYKVNVSTSGYFNCDNTNDIAEALSKLKCWVNFSLHGLGETHDRIVGVRGAYNKSIDFLKKLSDYNCRILLCVVVTEDIMSGIMAEKLIDLAYENGCKGIFFAYTRGKNDTISYKHYLIFINNIKSKKCYYKIPILYDSLREKNSQEDNILNSINIFENGELYFCPTAISNSKPYMYIKNENDFKNSIEEIRSKINNCDDTELCSKCNMCTENTIARKFTEYGGDLI